MKMDESGSQAFVPFKVSTCHIAIREGVVILELVRIIVHDRAEYLLFEQAEQK